MIPVDLGCGFDESVGHESLKDSIGIDRNFDKGKAGVAFPLIGDVCFIPVKTGCVSFTRAHAILEHLVNPGLCLTEMKRVMKIGSKGSILLPVDAHNVPQILKRFLKEFPFSLGWVIQKLMRTLTLWKIPGMLHVSQIERRDIEKWFLVEKVEYRRRLHKWFVHVAPMVILIKLGLLKTRLEVDEYAEVIYKIYNDPLELFEWMKICR